MPKKIQRRATCLAAATVLIAFLSLQELNRAEEKKAMNMNVKRITPVLFVKEIEPVLPFWVERLGFTKTIEVPHGNKIGFVALQKGKHGSDVSELCERRGGYAADCGNSQRADVLVHRGG
jgi:hypothetical protein